MKNYLVGVIAPAYADVFVTAENEAEAIEMVKAQLEAGEEPEFEVETGEPEDLDFEIMPLEKDTGEDAPAHRIFYVTLEAVSKQSVPIRAASEEAALALAHEMYCNTDTLEFTDDDVVRIVASVDGEITDECLGGTAEPFWSR